MDKLYLNIKELRKKNGYTQTELAHKVGYSDKSMIAKIEAGKVDLPRTKIVQFAEIFGVSPMQLMGYDSSDSPSITNIIPLPATKKVPLLGKIACGSPITAEENVEDYVDVPEYTHADFALTCQGDSMIGARILDGDIVYIRTQPEVENGEIAAVLIDGEATLKRVYYQKGKIILQPENNNYPPLIYEKDEILDVRILGKAVYFLSKVK